MPSSTSATPYSLPEASRIFPMHFPFSVRKAKVVSSVITMQRHLFMFCDCQFYTQPNPSYFQLVHSFLLYSLSCNQPNGSANSALDIPFVCFVFFVYIPLRLSFLVSSWIKSISRPLLLSYCWKGAVLPLHCHHALSLALKTLNSTFYGVRAHVLTSCQDHKFLEGKVNASITYLFLTTAYT